MHIVDGILAPPVLIGGAVVAAAGIGEGLRRLEPEQLPRVALLSAAFFVASLVHIPVGPTSTHLLLGGLIGMVLGWAAFPAIAVALFLQSLLFGYGGLIVLGVNIANMAVPAVVVWYLVGPALRQSPPGAAFGWGIAAGMLAIALSVALVGLSLALSGRAFVPAAWLIFITHLPVMVVEGLLAGSACALIHQVRPDLLGAIGAPRRA